MTRKIIFIIIGALLFLVLLALLWFWFTQRSPVAEQGSPSGFGTSTERTVQNRTSTTGAGEARAVTQTTEGYVIDGNILAGGDYAISQAGGRIGNFRLSSNGAGRYTIEPLDGASLPPGNYTFEPIVIQTGTASDSQTGTTTTSEESTVVGGTDTGAWIGSNLSTREFTPAQINQINSTAGISGTPLISTTPQPAGLGTSGLILGLAAAGCVAQWAASEALATGETAARTGASLGLGNVFVFDANAYSKQSANKFQSIEQCLVKTIAKAAIDQITRSVVTWINSGFNGQPSFVTNFNQYFANVANQAAGEFIKGSALSFLCSPFAPQIKIAVAQSYANRNNAASCSLSKVTNNINGFLRGNWGAGGWGGLLQMTTSPTNNPYGAYAYAKIGLQNSVANAQSDARNKVSPGGFLSQEKCETPAGPGNPKPVCKIITPGSYFEESLKQSSIKAPIDGLNLAQNTNDIITALINQVMIKTLYGGLSNSLGTTNPLAPAVDQTASAQAQALLSQLQSYLNFAGQYASVQQGSIVDIQNAQSGLNTAYNCWTTAASSSPTLADQAVATQKASEADAALVGLGARIDGYNNEITRANASLALIQNLQSQVYFASTPADVSAAARAISAAASQGAFFTQADITTAQQNRATLQTELTARNQATTATLAECQLFNGRI